MTGRPLPNCSVCKKPITQPELAGRRIIGWEFRGQSASRKGGSHVRHREHLDEWLCGGCSHVISLDLDPRQPELGAA